ncbi:MAG: haloalkane dehalogenase [Actinobacteria bacterium]|nr:haloalkane dehalogenase [Actinomycetota bacterium]
MDLTPRDIPVLDSNMAYREAGSGTPIVFLHGNPTSSYLWRNVMPGLGKPGRLLAPDLIGMGSSGKPSIDYRFDDHSRYLDAWFDAMSLDQAVLVGHDWGSVLALDRAARKPGSALGLVLLEAVLHPVAWDEFPPSGQELFRAFRTPAVGERMLLEENLLIERALQGQIVRELEGEELQAYRAPFPTPESRRPLLQWPREIPIDGEPADVTARAQAYVEWMASTPEVPKLLLTFEGAPWSGDEVVEWSERNVAGLEVVACGPAGHHAPEDQPEAIAAAISEWADRHQLRNA